MLPRTRPSRLKNTEARFVFPLSSPSPAAGRARTPLKTLNTVSIIEAKQLVTFPPRDLGAQKLLQLRP